MIKYVNYTHLYRGGIILDKKFISGFIAGAILFGSMGALAAGGQLIEVFYGIKDIKIDNVSQMPSQKPFTYNETTYVPLRFISDKLGKPVKWDAKEQTIYIGKFDGEKIYLGSSGKTHDDYDATALRFEYGNGTKTIKDSLKKEYSQYLLFKYEPTMTEKPSGEFNFKLDKNYTKLMATIGFTETSGVIDKPIKFSIYADDKRIYAGEVERSEPPVDINLNVTDAINLRIVTTFDSERAAEVGFFDAYFEKKN